MTHVGFTKEDFHTFTIEGLEPRMEAIRSSIQPKFQIIGEELRAHLAQALDTDMHLHIAQHARRTTNPPNDTWLAVASNKRGYKKHPHFQVGLFDDHLFIWLAYIYELPGKQEIAKLFLEHEEDLNTTIPQDYVVSLDHTKKPAESFQTLDLTASLERFRDVKKAEFLVGKHISSNDPLVQDGEALMNEIKTTMDTLLPLYKLSYTALNEQSIE
ncbi:DUF1054 domain-containing protein [Alkalihalobacillus sp. LMS6]|uniref:YktB family protein n=1 Tax=Bacillaceae TaxID=186817 RepID=UPI000C086B27|nr:MULTISPECIES: DUF1054 domain-containing protein [Bacillaceae]UTR04897.1 DUF1054 domain-containing protein [Alkalihalobacillus sp. LMS6]